MKNIRLTGKNILNGEKRVAIFVIIKKKRMPSWKSFILLFPLRALVWIGTYLRLRPLRRYANVSVEGYEKVLGSK